jgi:hypothetical protein
MEHIYLAGAVTFLALSWIYILILKAKIRDCMRYIEDRIDKANYGQESVSPSLEEGHEPNANRKGAAPGSADYSEEC